MVTNVSVQMEIMDCATRKVTVNVETILENELVGLNRDGHTSDLSIFKPTSWRPYNVTRDVSDKSSSLYQVAMDDHAFSRDSN